MMKMTAEQSLKDPNMLYLDIVSGVGGLVLYNLIQNGKASFSVSNIDWKLIFVVLLSRIIVDYVYSMVVSQTAFFGGSNNEFIFSSLIFIAIHTYLIGMNVNDSMTLYASTALVMFAVARLTHWG